MRSQGDYSSGKPFVRPNVQFLWLQLRETGCHRGAYVIGADPQNIGRVGLNHECTQDAAQARRLQNAVRVA